MTPAEKAQSQVNCAVVHINAKTGSALKLIAGCHWREAAAKIREAQRNLSEALRYLTDLAEDQPRDPNYTRPVNFTSTNNYGSGPAGEDDVYTVEEFRARCAGGSFNDHDGYGYPVKNKMANINVFVYPSQIAKITDDVTHDIWLNK